MKILVVSLLRIGDLILHQEIIRSIRREHPTGRISCLINDTVVAACDLIPEVDEWIIFDRKDLQKKMNQRQRWIFLPVLCIEKLIHELKSRQFDQVVNLTHSVISGHFCALLKSVKTEVRGLCLDIHGKMIPDLASVQRTQAMSYFNHQWSVEKMPLLHYTEILSLVSGYSLDHLAPTLERGKKSSVISFQILTSDERKHFDLEKWFDLIFFLKQKMPSFEMQILCSLEEANQIEKNIDTISQRKLGSPFQALKVTACSLFESIELIQQSAVFISHDTSLLHLAARTTTPIVQLSLGASHIYKTSSISAGTVVLAARRSCFPCAHQGSCHLPKFECHEDIQPEDLLSAIQFQLEKNQHELLSSLSMVQIVDGLWWLQNKIQRNFSIKQALYFSLGGQLQSGQFSKGVSFESRNSESFNATIG
jgi:ADP-heptose:LPS heptosyltransferase